MSKAIFTTAIGTPLTDDEQLHEEGLKLHIDDQFNNGMDGLLVAGSMGAMQLLKDDTYKKLVASSVDMVAGRGELLVGVGDTSLARSADRIEYVNNFKVDGVAILSPFFWNFGQEQLVEYFSKLADISKAPVYLYDLPQVTGTKLSMDTMIKLAEHPNIAGAKCSCDLMFTRQLIDRVGDKFRVIVANVELMDMLLHHGIYELLDGMWAIAPAWTKAVGDCAAAGDWAGAAENTRKITETRNLLVETPGCVAFTAYMNARGIPGRFMPKPFPHIEGAELDKFLANPIAQELIKNNPLKA